MLEFQIELDNDGGARGLHCLVVLQDADGNTKASAQVDALQTTCQGRLEVRAAKLWWPIGSRPQPGYRHTVKVFFFKFENFQN